MFYVRIDEARLRTAPRMDQEAKPIFGIGFEGIQKMIPPAQIAKAAFV
jgi:hypothetical protein